MNALTAHYHAANHSNGHARDCAYGAGGDCNCGAWDTTYFVVTAMMGAAEMVFHYGTDLDAAKSYARAMRAGVVAERRVRLRRLTFGPEDWEALQRFEETAETDLERIHDWATD